MKIIIISSPAAFLFVPFVRGVNLNYASLGCLLANARGCRSHVCLACMIVWVRKPECKQNVEEISTRDTPWTEYANHFICEKTNMREFGFTVSKKSTTHYNYAFFLYLASLIHLFF